MGIEHRKCLRHMHIGPILSKRRDSKFKKLIPVFLISLSFKRYTKFSKNSKINKHTDTDTHARTHTHTQTQSSLYQYFLNQIKENFLVSCFKNVLIKKPDSLDTFILNILPC